MLGLVCRHSQWEWVPEQKDTEALGCPQGQSVAVIILSTGKMDIPPQIPGADLTARRVNSFFKALF